MATRLGYGRVILEGDSEIVICAINSHSMCTIWRIHNQVITVHTLLQQFQNWKATHVHRGAIMTMHHLARWVASMISSGGNPRVF